MRKMYIDVKMGTGGNIALCHVLNYLKDHYSDDYEFNVISPYFDLFQACTAVSHVYTPQQYRDFVFDAKAEDGIIVEHRLYDMTDFIFKKLNYTQAWLELMNIPRDHWPEIDAGAESTPTTLTSKFNVYKAFPALKQMVDSVLKQLGKKKFILVQFEGGESPLVQVPMGQNGQPDWSKVPKNYGNEPLARIYPEDKAQEFVNLFKQEHPDVEIINYALPNERNYDGTLKFVLPYLCYYVLAASDNCIGSVTIDSSLQHLIAGLKPAVVMWHHTLPENFGYIYNNNLKAECRRDDILYFTALGPSAAKVKYVAPAELLEEVNKTIFKVGEL